MKIYGDIDRTAKGIISSEYPVYMNAVYVSELKEKIYSLKQRFDRGQVMPISYNNEKADLHRLEDKLRMIEDSNPKLSPGERERLNKMYSWLSSTIGKLLFSRSAMLKGLANPHAEATRMVSKAIEVPDEFVGICKDMNVLFDTKVPKISRNDASKMFKICGFLIGEETNVEVLRAD